MQHLQLPLLAGGNYLLDPPVMGGDLYNIKVKRGWWLSMPVEISKCTLIQQVLLPILTVKVLLLHQKDPCTDCTSPFTLAIYNLDPLLPHVNTGCICFYSVLVGPKRPTYPDPPHPKPYTLNPCIVQYRYGHQKDKSTWFSKAKVVLIKIRIYSFI